MIRCHGVDLSLTLLLAALGLCVLAGACSSGREKVRSEEPAETPGLTIGDSNLVQEEVLEEELGEIMYAAKVANIRQGRSKTSKIIGKLRPGQRVKAHFGEADWFAVFPPSTIRPREEDALGYVYAPLLKPVFAGEWGEFKYVRSSMNIRQGRSTKSRIVGKLRAGQKVKVDFLQKNWYAVFDPNETEHSEERALGYLSAPLLADAPPVGR